MALTAEGATAAVVAASAGQTGYCKLAVTATTTASHERTRDPLVSSCAIVGGQSTNYKSDITGTPL